MIYNQDANSEKVYDLQAVEENQRDPITRMFLRLGQRFRLSGERTREISDRLKKGYKPT